MVHLPIHLANEVRLGGPVQYRWMYPVERYMCTLKSYVRNRSHPEGSIAEGYLANECINFCSRYLHEDVQTRFNRVPRNNDECVSTKKGMSLDMYFKVHGINLEDKEDEEDEKHELDDAANDEGNGEQACNEDLGTIKKKTRRKTMCKKLHATDFNDRREVEFFGGQPIGPTKEVVSNLNQLLGTIVRNSRFVTLLYTSWHGVPKNLKEDMWEYANAVSTKNAENRSKQTCPHRMGSTNFGIVRKQLRDSKKNSEEPSRVKVFIATRTSKKGKEIDAKTQSTIAELQTYIEAGENDEDAFVGVLGKDQPGQVRCYGTSITKSSLKKDEEIRQVKVEYNNKVESLEKKMDGVCSLLKVLVHQVNPGMTEEKVAALVQAAQNSPLDASSSRPRNTPRSSESTHIPPKDTPEGINGSHGISHFA
ncbi:uncharacterized protein LOC110272063 [Arachis ipaensis]|uniref:uncharacterized protein LOC110272063 n=1 Tax=Arachis ipaensis TaxID=130454 RepID=UPI000A2B0680|nr:uncharacterized protein LOC110272063 [Arachis ipaensis]